MEGYYSNDELINLGLGSIGINNKISKKCTLINKSFIHIGNNCRIDDNCILSASKKKIIIGDYVHISNNVTISGNALIKLEDFSGLSSKVSIFGSTDDYSGEFMTNPCVGNLNEHCTNIKSEDIIIGKHAIIGCNSVILPGCSVISGASIGALSLVNRKINEVGIYHGNPVKFISKKSNNYLEIERKYFKNYYEMTNDLKNENTTIKENNNKENILDKESIQDILKKFINNFQEVDILNKYIEFVVDSLTFIQLQNYINKKFNIKIEHNMTINDIINFCKNDNLPNNKLQKTDNIINKFDRESNEKIVNNNLKNKENEILKNNIISISNNKNVTIIGTGHKLPSKKITNEFYSNFIDTNNDWILKRTGIESRYILDDKETLEELIISSSNESIKNADINPKDIDLLILCSSTPEDLFGDASKISYKIGAVNAFGFDIRNACNGFLTGLFTAENFLKNNNQYKIALVIGADCLSRFVDWHDRKSCILFGDGCGSVILKKSETENSGILCSFFKTHGDYNHILNINYKNIKENINGIDLLSTSYNPINIDGIKVFNFVIENLSNTILDFINKNGININDISYFILHQANIRIIDEISTRLNVDKNKFLSNINQCGNTSAASIPILLNESIKKNIIHKNNLILLAGFGAGMSIGMMIIKWTNEINNLKNLDKIALITGGSKGIGKSIAIKLRNKGYKTIICSRNKCNLRDIDHIVCDISNLNDLTELYNKIINKYGRLDILINNAGIEGVEKPLEELEFTDINNIININLLGTINVTKLFTNILKKTNGKIIMISSIAAGNNIYNCYRRTLYSMTKSAISTFVRGLAGELKDKCCVFSVNPPFVDTDLLDRIVYKYNIDKSTINEYGSIKNLSKLIRPNSISNIISLLIDNKTRYESGDEILILNQNETSYMKYLYEKTNIKNNLKFEIDDIERYDLNNVCFFQGQGTEIKIDILEIKKYIRSKRLEDIIINITNLTSDEIFEKINTDYNNTFYQQLIVFLISYTKFMIEKENDDTYFFDNIKYMVGYSLGEITSLVCSEKITFEDGLKIINTRGYFMHLISQNINTTMISIKGIDFEDLKNILHNNLYISINFSNNINIVGGDKITLNNFKNELANKDGIIINELMVEGAFHTPYYKEVGINLTEILDKINFIDNEIKVISNYNSIVYTESNFKDLIKNQIFNMVEWNNIINILRKIDFFDFKEFNLSTNYLSNYFKN